MAKKLQLTIAEPCHENWGSMSPSEKGRFCGSCEKQVVDFSNMSDRQVAEFFKKPSTGSVCGRFMSDQLDRDLEIPRKRIPWVRYFFQIMLPAFFISKASAQQKMGKISAGGRDTARIPVDHEFRTMGMVAPGIRPVFKDTVDKPVKGEVVTKVSKIRVNGTIVDENGEAIPNATIRIVNSGKSMAADGSGKFSFNTTTEQLIELELSSVGYQPEHYIYPFSLSYSSVVDINIQMKPGVEELPGVSCFIMGAVVKTVLVTGKVVTVKDSLVIDEIKDPVEPGKIHVYPNPITQGQTINISFKELEEGYYQLQLLASSGQIVQNKEIWIDREARVLTMIAPQVAAGSYFLVMRNKKTGKRFTAKIIIQ